MCFYSSSEHTFQSVLLLLCSSEWMCALSAAGCSDHASMWLSLLLAASCYSLFCCFVSCTFRCRFTASSCVELLTTIHSDLVSAMHWLCSVKGHNEVLHCRWYYAAGNPEKRVCLILANLLLLNYSRRSNYSYYNLLDLISLNGILNDN